MPRHKYKSNYIPEATSENITNTNKRQHDEALKQLEIDCKKRAEVKLRGERFNHETK